MKQTQSKTRQYHPPLFEHMPELGDEAVWDLLEMLYGLIDAYESHYDQALQRLRHQRHRQLQEAREDEHQLTLPIDEATHNPF